MVLFSHSGINAVILDIAIECKGARHHGDRRHVAAAFLRDAVAPFLGQAAVRGRRRRRRHRHASLADASLPSTGSRRRSAPIDQPHHRDRPCHRLGNGGEAGARGVKPMVMVNPNTAGKEAAKRRTTELRGAVAASQGALRRADARARALHRWPLAAGRGTARRNQRSGDRQARRLERAWRAPPTSTAPSRRPTRALPAWAATHADERARILHRAADLVVARVDEIAGLLTREQGKPIPDSRKGDPLRRRGDPLLRRGGPPHRRLDPASSRRTSATSLSPRPSASSARSRRGTIPSTSTPGSSRRRSRRAARWSSSRRTRRRSPSHVVVHCFAEAGLPPGVLNDVPGNGAGSRRRARRPSRTSA